MGLNDGCGFGFRGLTKGDMAYLEKWYGMTDYFGYATGFKSFDDIRKKLLEPIRPNRLAFMIFAGDDKQTIGFVYGELITIEMNRVFWIHILIIEPGSQRKGFGTCAVNKLVNYARMQYGPLACIVAVSNRNIQGLSFWRKAGFSHSADMEESLHQFGSPHVSILKRVIK